MKWVLSFKIFFFIKEKDRLNVYVIQIVNPSKYVYVLQQVWEYFRTY